MVDESQIVWNPYTKGYFHNPYPHLKECRENNPVHKGVHGNWMLFKYEDVSSLLRSSDYLVSDLPGYLKEKEPIIFKNESACPILAQSTQKWMLYLNGEEHKLIRKTVAKVFNRLDFQDIVNQSLGEIEGEFGGRNSFDLVDLAYGFIVKVIERALDIRGRANYGDLTTYANLLTRVQDIYVPISTYKEINDSFEWGRNLYDDSSFKNEVLKQADLDGIHYSEEDLYSIMSLMLTAGIETSRDHVSMALLEILMNRDLIDYSIQCGDKELQLLIEELFRFTAAVQYTIRVNQEPLEVQNVAIPADTRIYLSIAGANRDPDQFISPDQILPDRKPNNHLSFGASDHLCLGAGLARAEMKYGLKRLVALLKDFELADSNQVVWSKQIFARTMNSAPLKRKWQA